MIFSENRSPLFGIMLQCGKPKNSRAFGLHAKDFLGPTCSISRSFRPDYPNAPGARLLTKSTDGLLRCERVPIDLIFGELRQEMIGLLLLLEALVQLVLLVAQGELASQCCGGAIGGDFVVFELLRRSDEARIA